MKSKLILQYVLERRINGMETVQARFARILILAMSTAFLCLEKKYFRVCLYIFHLRVVM